MCFVCVCVCVCVVCGVCTGTGCVEPLPGHWVYHNSAGGHVQQETEEDYAC